MDALGLYLSVPFCKAKCSFCNFASDAFPPEQIAAYVDRLCAEVSTARSFAEAHGLHLPNDADTIFIGGGTPSLLEPAGMRRLFNVIREHFAVDSDAEITVEAAPGQISDEMLEAMLLSGVNRLSLGVQSFVDAESRAVGRTHTGASCRAELQRLGAAGVRHLSVDLIVGLPHQTVASWEESLCQVVDSGVDHVSVYMLEVDEDSRLGRELIGPGVRYGAPATPNESLVADLYAQACQVLQSEGICQYEISNFAREGLSSRHNRKYWTRQPYLGLGLDAHSMLLDTSGTAVRFANGDDLDTYISGNEPRELEPIDALAAWEESIFLGLRLNEGVCIADLSGSFPVSWIDAFLATSRDLAREGLMRVSADGVSLTDKGRILSSSIFGELLAGAAV